MCTVSTASKSSSCSILPKNNIARIATGVLTICIPSFILLYTKSAPKELKFKTKLDDSWHNFTSDWLKILKIWNVIFNPSEYKKLIDERWIGTTISVVNERITEISEDGRREVAITDLKIKCLPTGVCGNIDSYVFKQFKNLYDAIGGVEKIFVAYYLLNGQDIEKFSNLWSSKTFKASV